jgi:hypothetical protein
MDLSTIMLAVAVPALAIMWAAVLFDEKLTKMFRVAR